MLANFSVKSHSVQRWSSGGASLATVGLLLALAGLSGCDVPLSPQAIQTLQTGYDSYTAGDDEATIRGMNAFLKDHGKSSRADEAYYLRGLARKNQRDPVGAKADLNAALRRTRKVELRVKARIAVGDLAYEAGDMAAAENMYRDALADMERGQRPSDHAHYRLGCVLQRQGRWPEADVQFDRVVYFFGDSEIGRLAARRAHCTAWTVQAAAFTDKARADQAASDMNAAKSSAKVQVSLRDGRPLFVLQLGRFPTYEQAAASLAETRKLYGDAFVTPTR